MSGGMADRIEIIEEMDMVCCEETIGDDDSLLITSHSMLLSNFEDAWLSKDWSRSEEKLDSDGTSNSNTNKKRSWTETEKKLFNEGLELYGRKWTKIAKFIETRTVLQVRAYARKLNAKHQNEENSSTSTEIVRLTRDVDDENVDIEDKETDETDVTNTNTESKENLTGPSFIEFENNNSNHEEELSKDEVVDICSETEIEQLQEESSSTENELVENIEIEVESESNKVLPIPIPEQELILNRNSVTESEKEYHHEYFEGKFPKTPDRYMRIRNHILDMWEKVKPNYLNKTSVRFGLKNCGDVNCISKIHEYLEMCGAINFGCEQVSYERSTFEIRPVKKKTSKNDFTFDHTLKQSTRLRKRRIMPEETVLGSNYTIQHTPEGEVIITNPIPDVPLNKVPKTINPFKLITCSKYLDEPPPFEVYLDLSALIVMDFHAHLSQAEVIGLLGGHYDIDRRLVELKVAEPCLSLSTGVQCEMDPVSQTMASVSIEERGFSVVGWYHSHPTFPPNPSIRDLETQAKYQDWFSQRGCPFLGVILNPYHAASTASSVRCLLVEKEIIATYRRPFQLDLSLNEKGFQVDSCVRDLNKVVKEIEKCPSPIQLSALYSEEPKLTYLDKVLRSITFHMTKVEMDVSTVEHIAREIRNLYSREMQI